MTTTKISSVSGRDRLATAVGTFLDVRLGVIKPPLLKKAQTAVITVFFYSCVLISAGFTRMLWRMVHCIEGWT